MNLSRFKNSFAIVSILVGSFVFQTSAQAGLGIYLASANPDQAWYGIILAAVGLGVAIDGASSKSVTQQCTPGNPCNNVSFGNNDNSFTNCALSPTASNCQLGYWVWSPVTGTVTTGSNTYHEANLTQVLVGLVMLGKDKAESADLLPLTAAMEKELQISAKEAAAFNLELPRINLIMNDFSTRVAAQATEQKMSSEESKAAARALWENEAKPVLSAEAFSATEKVAATYSSILN
jgi:hypothetical protein